MLRDEGPAITYAIFSDKTRLASVLEISRDSRAIDLLMKKHYYRDMIKGIAQIALTELIREISAEPVSEQAASECSSLIIETISSANDSDELVEFFQNLVISKVPPVNDDVEYDLETGLPVEES